MIQQGATVGVRLEKLGQLWRRVKPYLPRVLGGLVVLTGFILALRYFLFDEPKMRVPDLYWLSPKVRFDMENEARRTNAYIIGGCLAVIGIILSFWRIRTLEKQVGAMEKQIMVAQEGQITERFTRAIEQLGSTEMAIRLGGIYALERIANDSDKDYWPIMETLTAYVRQNAPWPRKEPSSAVYDLATDIQTILTVLGRRKYNYSQGEKKCLDLTDTDLRLANLDRAHLERALLHGANLQGTFLWGTHLEGTKLRRVEMNGAIFGKTHMEGADLREATGLTWEQLADAIIDDKTKLPDYLKKQPPRPKRPEGNGEK